MFRIQLTLPVVVLLTILSTFCLVAAFYLGMVTEKSMHRPPEYSEVETNISAETPLTEEDLKFFGLSEQDKDKDKESINLDELRDLKDKTDRLIKKPKTTELKNPEKPKPVTPDKPKSNKSEKNGIITKEPPKPKTPEAPKSENPKVKTPKIPISSEKPKVAKKSSVIDEVAKYTIQVFASRKHDNAKKLVEKLKGHGFEDAFIFKHTAGGNTLYRVRVGKVERSKTKELAEKLKNLKFIQSVQVTRF